MGENRFMWKVRLCGKDKFHRYFSRDRKHSSVSVRYNLFKLHVTQYYAVNVALVTHKQCDLRQLNISPLSQLYNEGSSANLFKIIQFSLKILIQINLLVI